MSWTALEPIILAILALGGGGGIWAYLTSRRAEPISRETAQLASAQGAADIALSIAKQAQEASQRATEAADAAMAKALEAETRIASLEVRLVRWSAFGADLIERWPIHRLEEIPPTLPE